MISYSAKRCIQTYLRHVYTGTRLCYPPDVPKGHEYNRNIEIRIAAVFFSSLTPRSHTDFATHQMALRNMNTTGNYYLNLEFLRILNYPPSLYFIRSSHYILNFKCVILVSP